MYIYVPKRAKSIKQLRINDILLNDFINLICIYLYIYIYIYVDGWCILVWCMSFENRNKLLCWVQKPSKLSQKDVECDFFDFTHDKSFLKGCVVNIKIGGLLLVSG